ncbi:jg15255 [Pararge aegeria aegeria]|uniref:Jg15255 protein n=1 Tax=Pararge aegeria aegeria TaxID=348720 RepID=A0A8S4SN68_9NEOP|nr:jg15255 [Pararge aegeria aegeria]
MTGFNGDLYLLNIVRKPACLRVLYNVLKGVWSPPIRVQYSVVDYGRRTPSHCWRRPVSCSGPVMGWHYNYDDLTLRYYPERSQNILHRSLQVRV